jgi:predicted TIM-barrel fold metal-dependent hydrolase
MSEATALPEKLIDIHNHVAIDDPGAERLLAGMDAANIEATLVMGTARRSNEDMLLAVREHPGRLVGGAYVDPREGPAAIDKLAHFHDEGIRVVKLFPNLGYYPDDESFRPFFDAVAERGMAVLSHCGWLAASMGVTASYYSRPERFEKPIRTYPETIFILAHMGGIAGFLEAAMLTTRTPNTYVDCSPGQGVWVLETGGKMAGSIPADRLMWGLDSYDVGNWLPRQRAALETLGFGPHLEKIFYTNARSLLERIGAL